MGKSHNKEGQRRLRVRTRRLEEIDDMKLSLALWLVAKGIVERAEETVDKSDEVRVSEPGISASAEEDS